MRKLPPYGAYLDSLQQRGKLPKNDVYLFCGINAWRKAGAFHSNKQRPTTLCLPPWESPNTYEWPVENCEMLVMDTGNCELEYLEEIVFVLYDNGAKIVRTLDVTQKLTTYRKESINEQVPARQDI